MHKYTRIRTWLLIIFVLIFSHGLSRSGTEYGPLTDIPDWSYAGRLPYIDKSLGGKMLW